ncbi:MAG: flagellar hook protein [Epsilonproteobacteria bacterium]|nr:flagellar hook protein [Campylobacterota bacterium]
MATSSLSSLGLGSDGALSYDTIDKLRTVDEKVQLDPIDKKITTNTTKQNDLTSLTSLVTTLKTSTNSLASEMTYLKRTTTVSNSAVSITAQSGTDVQDFSLHVTTLAKQDVYQSKTYTSQTATFASADDTLTLKINGKSYDFNVTSTTTLSELKDMINDKAGDKVTASILNVGGTEPYRLVIKSDTTGKDNAITLSSTGTTNADLGFSTAANHLQEATDASFTYNGVAISRATNTFDDLIKGVSVTLNETQETGKNTTVSITQDSSELKKTVESLVSSYNSLMSQLTELTKYDIDTKTAGTFQGVSQITALSREVRKQVLSVDSEGRSLADYGLELNTDGQLEFDSSVFDKKMKEDPAELQEYFRGSTTYKTTQYIGTPVASDALNIATEEFKINGTSITFSTSAGATAAENLTALQTAINKAGISGIEATLGSNNNIYLKSTIQGLDIEITGDKTKLASLGLQPTTAYAQSETKEGVFTSFNTLLNSYTNSKDGILSLYKTSLTTEKKSLTTEREKTVTNLDKKYDLMAKRFAEYDRIINQLQTSFDSLSLMIKQSYTSQN